MKNVLITGTSRGIGKSIKDELLSLGYNVFGSSSTDFDLTNPNNAKNLYIKAKEALGNIDILINNAGRYVWEPIEKTQENEAISLFNLDLIVPYLMCSYAISDMKATKWGRIINIGSISGVVGEANASAYSASKAGLSGLTKSLALEVAQFNITVNQINPGWVESDLTNNALDEDEKKQTLDIIPQKRFVEPYEIAKLCKYLISDDAKGITGQCINICAGLSCGC